MPMTDYELAKAVAYALRTITVTDPISDVAGANAKREEHQAAHAGLMAGKKRNLDR